MTEMVYDGDEEDDKVSGKQHAGRPNAYFARIREEQEEELEEQERGDTFGGAFRGTRPAPHGGVATVRPDQVKGAEELCWCGQLLGHDWPGKNVGAKHPKVGEGSMTTETEVDRRSLRAYHRRLQDFILGCIKDDNLKYRQTKNSIILYPPDDTSPITVYARNTDRQIRQLQKWYLDHVYVEPAKGSVDEEQITALAKAVNSPEHPVEEKQKARLPMGDPATEVGGTTHKPSEEPPVAPPADQPDGVRSNAEWVPYQRDDGSTDEFIETDGTTFRCRLCLGGEHPLLSENRRSIGGHKRMWHTDRTNLHAPETRAKAGDTTRYNHVKARLIETLVPLLESVGYEAEAKDDPRVKVLEKELAEKDKALSKVQGQLDEATGRVEELEARLALMREALTA